MWGRQVHFLYIRVSASPNERFTFSLLGWLWRSTHALHCFSRTRRDRHAHYHPFIWHAEWWHTPAHTILPELPRYTCRWFRVGAYYLQATLQPSRSSPGRQEESRDVIYLQGESTNTNRLCTFHFFNLLVVNPGKMSSSPVVELVLSTWLSERATAAAAFSMHSDWKKKHIQRYTVCGYAEKKRQKQLWVGGVVGCFSH